MSTAIEWTDITWNPVTGCRKVSPGCDHCYAATLAKRLKAMGSPRYQIDGPDGPGFGVTLHPDKIRDPIRWKKPRTVFVNSMSDLFHSQVDEEFIAQIWAVMSLAPHHVFQILTKRPKRMADLLGAEYFGDLVQSFAWEIIESEVDPQERRSDDIRATAQDPLEPLENVWIGTSIESLEFTWRADYLRQTPAAVRFLSLEPLIGPMVGLDLQGIDWVIVGGESGPGHRPMKPEWVRPIRNRCIVNKIPFFFKQWGGPTPKSGGRELDGRTWDEMPEVGS